MTAGTGAGGVRSLLVSDIVPRRPASGAVQRLLLVARELAAHGPVDALFVPVTAGERPDGLDDAAGGPDAGLLARHHVIDLPAPGPAARVDGALRGPTAAYLRHRRLSALGRLPGWVTATRYDLVWFNRQRVWMPLRGAIGGPAVVDVDDLEDVLLRHWLRRRRGPHGRPLTPWQLLQANRSIRGWQAVHRLTAAEAAVVVHSRQPAGPVWRRPRSIVVPNSYPGPDPRTGPRRPLRDPTRPPTVLLSGTFHWPPNADAARWLVRRIAPLVRRQVPDLRVVLVGEAPEPIRRLADGNRVQVLGTVPEMAPHLRSADLVVVPLRAGSGTRIKILEAFAHGVPVVSTTIGAGGLDVTPGVHLALADTAPDLARACVDLLRDPVAADRTAAAARHLLEAHHRPELARERVREAVRMARATDSRPTGSPSPHREPSFSSDQSASPTAATAADRCRR